MKKKCGIPSYNVGECDQEWGHEGRLHSNAGDGFYARDYDEEHQKRQTQMIVDPNRKPIPLVAELVDNNYKAVTKLTLPDMVWPSNIRWRGRIFALYAQTQVIPTPEEISRRQLYREIELWDAP
jgi:hypothetical protein